MVSKKLCIFTTEGRTGSQSFIINNHKAHCEVRSFGDKRILFGEFKDRISQGNEEYLTAFLKRANMNSGKIPKLAGPMQVICIKWASKADANCRPCVLLTIRELEDEYRKAKGTAPKSKWNANDPINEIPCPIDGNAPAQRSKNVKDPNSLKQEFKNIFIHSMALNPPKGAAKDHCQEGHEMEGVYSCQLMNNRRSPWER